jgi:hypothetical protein
MRKLALASAALTVAAWLHATTRYDRARTLEFATARALSTVRIAYAEERCRGPVTAVVDDARLPLQPTGGAFTVLVERLAPGRHRLEVQGPCGDGRWEIDAEELP